MDLTGKSREDFRYWFDINYLDFWDHYQNKRTLLNVLIIEWFDSIGICISIEATRVKNDYGFDFYIYYNNFGKSLTNESFFINRQEATEKAIEKANEIYNNL